MVGKLNKLTKILKWHTKPTYPFLGMRGRDVGRWQEEGKYIGKIKLTLRV